MPSDLIILWCRLESEGFRKREQQQMPSETYSDHSGPAGGSWEMIDS